MWLCTKHTIHWKTFAVHQAHAIMYCTRQVIQGENFRDWLKNAKNAKVFPLESFAVYGIWALLYNVLENYKKICNDSLLSLSLQIQWFIQDAVQLPGAVLTVES